MGLMLASAISTFSLCFIMCPIDCLSTRYFNQPYDNNGQGILYNNAFEGGIKIIRIEGL